MMARQEFSSPEAVAIAQIDTAVANLDTAVSAIDTAVDDLANTDVALLSQKIDNISMWENYTKTVTDFNVNLHYSSMTSVLSVSGSGGMLKALVLRCQEFASMNLYVDGVLVIDDLAVINDTDTDRTNIPLDVTFTNSFELQMQTSGGNNNVTGFAVYGLE